MTNFKTYTPVWPETAILWGAGATAALGIRPTSKLSNSLYQLAQKDLDLTRRVEKFIGYNNPSGIEAVEGLLTILGDPEATTQKVNQSIESLFQGWYRAVARQELGSFAEKDKNIVSFRIR